MNTGNNMQGGFCRVLGPKSNKINTFSRLKSSANAFAGKEILNIVCIVHVHTPSCLRSRASGANASLVHFHFLRFSHWRGEATPRQEAPTCTSRAPGGAYSKLEL